MDAKRTPPGWSSSQLTPSCKPVKSESSIDHIGAREKHFLDQFKAQACHQARVLKELEIDAPGWDEGLAVGLSAVGLSAVGLSGPGIFFGEQAKLEKSVDAALAQKGVLLTVGYIPIQGDRNKGREWKIMDGAEWTKAMRDERRWRAGYRDKKYNRYDRLDLAMEAQYCRLPPWLAQVVKAKMAIDPERAAELMIELGERFAKRFGVNVIGVGLHSEGPHDWHVHLLFSRSLEQLPKKVVGRKGRKERTRLNGIIRAELKASGKAATPKCVADEVRRAIASNRFPDPQATWKDIEYVRRRKGGNLAEPRVWGPAYRNKYWIYRAANEADRSRVAESNDRPSSNPGGFRWWLNDLEARGTSPEDHFSDVWVEAQWQEICRQALTPHELEAVDNLRKKGVENYLEVNTSLPTPIEAVAAHLKRERGRVKELEEQAKAFSKKIARNEELQRKLAEAEAEKTCLEDLRIGAEQQSEKLREQIREALSQLLAQPVAKLISKLDKRIFDILRYVAELVGIDLKPLAPDALRTIEDSGSKEKSSPPRTHKPSGPSIE